MPAGSSSGMHTCIHSPDCSWPASHACSSVLRPGRPRLTARRVTGSADLLLVVDCLLPGQVRNLGQRTIYVSARRPARITARDCQIRGGEYVAYDRADLRSALAAWLPAAEQGDVEAQVIVGRDLRARAGSVPGLRRRGTLVSPRRGGRQHACAGQSRSTFTSKGWASTRILARPSTGIAVPQDATTRSKSTLTCRPLRLRRRRLQATSPRRLAALRQELAARSQESRGAAGRAGRPPGPARPSDCARSRPATQAIERGACRGRSRESPPERTCGATRAAREPSWWRSGPKPSGSVASSQP